MHTQNEQAAKTKESRKERTFTSHYFVLSSHSSATIETQTEQIYTQTTSIHIHFIFKHTFWKSLDRI